MEDYASSSEVSSRFHFTDLVMKNELRFLLFRKFSYINQTFFRCYRKNQAIFCWLNSSRRNEINSRGFHFSMQLNVKSFQEKENEYAHGIMEKYSAYASSIAKQPRATGVRVSPDSPKEITEFAKKNTFTKDSESESYLVFVYGTLKINEPNYDQMTDSSLGEASYIGQAQTVQKWPLVIASKFNIPFLLYKEGTGKNVKGDLFVVDGKKLSHMDAFESHPTYYTRMQVEVKVLEENKDIPPKIMTPWVYFLKCFRPELLELPFIEDYHSKSFPGLEYVTRYNRPQAQDYYSDVKM